MTKTGFSLIEILITIGILAIMIAFALPNYTEYMVREHRLEAKYQLLQLANALEKYHFTVSTYRDANFAALNFPEYVAHDNYHLNIDYANENDYLISATPLKEQAARDASCGTLMLNAGRQKLISGRGNEAECWG